MEEKITKRITRRAKDPSAPKVAKGRRSLAAAVSQDDIARRAYELFEARGGIHGFHLEDWLAAEAELTSP